MHFQSKKSAEKHHFKAFWVCFEAFCSFGQILKDDPFFVIYGDNYLCFDLLDLKLFNEKMNADISILFHWRKDISNSGVALFNSKDRITKFVEKPLDTNDDGDWVNAGVYEDNGLDFSPDSRAGIQVSLQFNEQFSSTICQKL